MIARLAGIPVAVVVLLGTLLLPPLPPSVDLLLVVPTFLIGVVAVLAGLTSGGTGSPPTARWTALALAGWLLVGAGSLGMTLQTPAGSRALLGNAARLADHCQGPPGVRVERDLLPLLQQTEALLPGQPPGVQATAEQALRTHLPRCIAQLRSALDDPRGTHGSWGMLRDWLAAHPAWVEIEPTLAGAELRPRSHRPARPPASLDLR